jgi:dihydroflavonol-4-reductase
MQKALVTGAAGFIGSNVVRELLAEGVNVRAMVLPGEDERNLAGVDVEKVPGDILDPPSLDAALQGCDTLFHLAALYSLQAPRKAFFDVNLQGSRNMLWAAKKADLEKIVYTASIAALGLKAGKLPPTRRQSSTSMTPTTTSSRNTSPSRRRSPSPERACPLSS